MKPTITSAELARLDRLAMQADTLMLLARQLVEAIGAELAVEEWDARAWTAIERWVRAGGAPSVDEFLAGVLKVRVTDN